MDPKEDPFEPRVDMKEGLMLDIAEQARQALVYDYVHAEAEELGEILDEYERIVEMPTAPEEKWYSNNRASRRLAAKQKPKFVNKPNHEKKRKRT